MAGHLLATMNQEASDAIQSVILPKVGTGVIYKPRGSVLRNGMLFFPALVMKPSNGSRGVDLLVIYDAGEMNMEFNVLPDGTDESGHTFKDETSHVASPGNLGALYADLDAMKKQIEEVREMVVGDFTPTGISVYQMLQGFETKLNSAPVSRKTKK